MEREIAERIAYVLNLRASWLTSRDMADLARDFQNEFPDFVWYFNAEARRVEIYNAG
jgi:hypothetical protein